MCVVVNGSNTLNISQHSSNFIVKGIMPDIHRRVVYIGFYV